MATASAANGFLLPLFETLTQEFAKTDTCQQQLIEKLDSILNGTPGISRFVITSPNCSTPPSVALRDAQITPTGEDSSISSFATAFITRVEHLRRRVATVTHALGSLHHRMEVLQATLGRQEDEEPVAATADGHIATEA